MSAELQERLDGWQYLLTNKAIHVEKGLGKYALRKWTADVECWAHGCCGFSAPMAREGR